MKKILLSSLIFISISVQANEPFTGLYQSSSVDSMKQLMLLDNQKFCFALSAGNMDMMTGGTWKKGKQTNDFVEINLNEQKMSLSDIVLVANPKVDDSTLSEVQQKTHSQRVLFLTPPALFEALGEFTPPLVAFSKTEKMTTKLKWAYASDDATPMYAHIGIPNDARYIFIASPPKNKLYRFHIGNSRNVKLNPNPQAGRPSLDLTLIFDIKNNQLDDFGEPEKVTLAAQKAAWQQCEPKDEGFTTRVKDDKKRTLLNAQTIESLKPYFNSHETLETWGK